jgi:hypothetical protein
MNVASSRIGELVQRLTSLTGEDEETALARAVEERLSRLSPSAAPDRRAALLGFLDKTAALPVKDARQPDDLLGFGPDGLPA